MANKHFGNAGDVFKHLMLGELLRAVDVRSYLETHAGSAAYPETSAPSRKLDWRLWQTDQGVDDAPGDHGCPESGRILGCTAYDSLLFAAGQAGVYPGSALLAMRELPEAMLYLFDTDMESIVSLRAVALAHKHTESVLADGLAGALEIEAELTFIDPFDPFDGNPNSIEVFRTLADQGRSVLLWYPLLSADQQAPVTAYENIYQVRFQAEYDQSLAGCGLITANLASSGAWAKAALDRAYAEFVRRWQDYLLPADAC